jgi:hypothetical protein
MSLVDRLTGSKRLADAQCGQEQAMQARPVTLLENLQFRRDAKARELADLDAAIEGLKDQPKIEQLLELLSRI